ncbi:hypothetical protein [Desulfogranum marinum]|uniref:hypothetical protein n=1 Tax=Desulfogranum marinum TaxID=453220 RepID=UPI0019640DCB|nr:hypothetical protein [Desulfogranum marinum]
MHFIKNLSFLGSIDSWSHYFFYTRLMATLKKTNEIDGYFMTDASTWVADMKELGILRILLKAIRF